MDKRMDKLRCRADSQCPRKYLLEIQNENIQKAKLKKKDGQTNIDKFCEFRNLNTLLPASKPYTVLTHQMRYICGIYFHTSIFDLKFCNLYHVTLYKLARNYFSSSC